MVNNKLLNTVGKNNIKNDEIINIINIIFGALLVIAIFGDCFFNNKFIKEQNIKIF